MNTSIQDKVISIASGVILFSYLIESRDWEEGFAAFAGFGLAAIIWGFLSKKANEVKKD